MVTCTPRGICSWNYHLEGPGERAVIELDWIGGQGRLVINGENHAVSKHGAFSGRWSLESTRGTVLAARKSNAFARRFEISGSCGPAELSARSAFGRTMVLQGQEVDCEIFPVHALTRRAVITGHHEDFRLVAFAFWLTVLTWRRAANNGAAG